MSTSDNSLLHEQYQRSNNYDPDWVIENEMGPNPLWLIEALTEVMEIKPGMRVLDLGCGRAVSSIFLAKEFGAHVDAADLWIDATDNQDRIVEAGVEGLVTPVDAEAHDLPFAKNSFDAIVSLDAFQYFGTADLYLGYLIRLLKPGGQIGAVMPAMLADPDEVPPHLVPFWDWEYCCFHGPNWWRRHWDKTGLVRVDLADSIENGWRDWLRFHDLTTRSLTGARAESAQSVHDMLAVDQGRHLGFTRIVATRC